ncbi:hypothetical protein [Terrabacter sp. Soil811]|uniref:hypothetical protein n=1 Tax=Terrabacter sp. Soil811 TaxID=1736419 RepID=UPI0006F4895F|nr:hypothetical protein [Terrabacter sp. Soil811]
MRRFWPNFGEDDERLYDLTKAYIQATSDRQMQVARHPEDPAEELQWLPIPPSMTRSLLQVVCTHAAHRAHECPKLAELWHTDAHGPLFLSRLAGAAFDPPDDPDDPFAPPTAVLTRQQRDARRALFPSTSLSPVWEALPVTVVRLFLDDPSTFEAELWVKCVDHGPAKVDRGKLGLAYLEDAKRRRQGRDTREPTVIGLHTVGAVSSP